MKPRVLSLAPHKLGMGAYTYNPCTLEVGAADQRVQGHCPLDSDFETCLGCMKLYVKNKNTQQVSLQGSALHKEQGVFSWLLETIPQPSLVQLKCSLP